MTSLDLPTHSLHYRIDGDADGKPWLTFCNSLGTDLHMWDEQAEALSSDFRILRYDLRGHGRSTSPGSRYALSDLGRDAIALFDSLGIAQTHFCGLSIGGLTGQWLGVHASERFNKIIVAATAAKIGTAESWATRIDAVRQKGIDSLTASTTERWFSPAFHVAEPNRVNRILESFAATSVDGYVGCCTALADADLRSEIGQIDKPLLAISGADDPVCRPADLRTIAAAVKHGRHVSLSGRHIINIESAKAFNDAIQAFLYQ
ncbi:3-oxoadipate enol-lactonase (plasmid) [Rhizobium sp. YTUHZ045]|uniref:3-oxoadipate enol-lactonase n=1 Tax=Rhizobium sp. YTUHZ045 TaxID=2962888 RepID=UPI003DA7E2CA